MTRGGVPAGRSATAGPSGSDGGGEDAEEEVVGGDSVLVRGGVVPGVIDAAGEGRVEVVGWRVRNEQEEDRKAAGGGGELEERGSRLQVELTGCDV